MSKSQYVSFLIHDLFNGLEHESITRRAPLVTGNSTKDTNKKESIVNLSTKYYNIEVKIQTNNNSTENTN